MADKTVLLVDDDADVRDSLRALLESAGFAVKDFESGRKLLADPALVDAGCLIADIRMPDMDGLALQEELAARKIGLPVIIITGHGDVPLAVRAMKAGAVDFIEKPFDDELLLATCLGRAKPEPGIPCPGSGGAHCPADRPRATGARAARRRPLEQAHRL